MYHLKPVRNNGIVFGLLTEYNNNYSRYQQYVINRQFNYIYKFRTIIFLLNFEQTFEILVNVEVGFFPSDRGNSFFFTYRPSGNIRRQRADSTPPVTGKPTREFRPHGEPDVLRDVDQQPF